MYVSQADRQVSLLAAFQRTGAAYGMGDGKRSIRNLRQSESCSMSG